MTDRTIFPVQELKVSPKKKKGMVGKFGISRTKGVDTAEDSKSPATMSNGTGQDGFWGFAGTAAVCGEGKPEGSSAKGAMLIARGVLNADTTRGRVKRMSHQTPTAKGIA